MRRSPKTEARSNRSKRSIALLRSKRFNAKIRGGFARFDNSQNVKMSRDYHRHPEGGMRTYNAACGDESSLKFATRRSRRTTNEIDSKRRTIQSQAESGFLTRRRPSIVKSHFLYYRPRITNGVCNEESGSLINPVCSGTACCCCHSRGAAAGENPADSLTGHR